MSIAMKNLEKIFFVLLISVNALAQQTRNEINIPDILGYKTLKCDFHSHTVFSDGNVWPDLRVREAFRDGLDAIAITDHIEYRPHKDDLVKNHNRSFEIAKVKENQFGVIVIKGSEITRKMPPGHLNALFIKDSNPIDTADFMTAIKIAKEQGAFIQWNHPFWLNPVFPVKDGKPTWFPVHQELFDNHLLDGIEIVNERAYYPDVYKWCIENNITITGNSDIHDPVGYFFEQDKDDHRPVTLVFSKEKSEEGIKEALFAHRTAVFHHDSLFGKEEYLNEIFKNSVRLIKDKASANKGADLYFQVNNNSDIPMTFILEKDDDNFKCPARLLLPAQKTIVFSIKPKSKDFGGQKELKLNYFVQNFLTGPERCLKVEFNVTTDLK
jgi:hypothetical protein